jgi:FAD dependent oxidoreductase TIGR03364
MKKNAIVIGAGIVGLACTRALATRGYRVTVIDRSDFAVGASIRNFGMVWPIGQPDGNLYERALLSKSIWIETCEKANIWRDPVGSLHLAYSDMEMEVIEDFYSTSGKARKYEILDASKASRMSSAINGSDLKGGIYSPDEMILDSPKAIRNIPSFLSENYDVEFKWNTHVNHVETGKIYAGNQVFEADEIFICNGPDFENLFPEVTASLPLTKCKLQMMRFETQPDNWRMGPSLCGGLSLTHYTSFKQAGDSLEKYKEYVQETMPAYVKWGIHVMVSQNSSGEIIVGDSHEYGPSHDPFDKSFINDLILDYLKKFARFPSEKIAASWNGIYPKMLDGSTEIVLDILPGVKMINALSGAGMTLSFGLCDQVIGGTYSK